MSGKSKMAEAQDQKKTLTESDKKRLKRKYTEMLRSTDIPGKMSEPPIFLTALKDNIKQGPDGLPHVDIQLELLPQHDKVHLLLRFPEDDLNPLQLAAFFHRDAKLIEKLIEICPELMWKQRTGEYEGQTVLHILILRRNMAGAEAILERTSTKKDLGRSECLLNGKATGTGFKNTVMMGELPLSVAALTFNLDMVELLDDNGANLHMQNSQGDTVFHSLVSYGALYPDMLDDVQSMIHDLYKLLLKKCQQLELSVDDVFLIENNEGLTALRLAAALAQPKLFQLILNLGGIYHRLYFDDGLWDSSLCDVTELDPAAQELWRKQSNLTRESNKPDKKDIRLQDTAKAPSRGDIMSMVQYNYQKLKKPRLVSVLEIICETAYSHESSAILDTGVVREIIKMKWRKYLPFFCFWAVLHLLWMVLLSAYAMYKAKLTSEYLDGNSSAPSVKAFVTSVAAITTVTPLVVVPVELMLRFYRKQPWKFKLHHHNGPYRLMLVVFSLCLAVDSIWYLAAGPDNNHLLALALLIGWWFLTFFLRPFKRFSFFTVMLQKIFFGDFLRFSTVIVLEWVAFSIAMHVTYLAVPAAELPDQFNDLGVTMLTMFQLLLGMAEVDVLYQSRNTWLVVTLYVTFTLLTFVLLMNALIAMMSNTCSSVSENRVRQWQLQRLSVVLLLENMMPTFMTHNCGKKTQVGRFDLSTQRPYTEYRYFLKVISAQKGHKGLRERREKKDEKTKMPPGEEDKNTDGPIELDFSPLLTAYAKQECRLGHTNRIIQFEDSLRRPSQRDQQSAGDKSNSRSKSQKKSKKHPKGKVSAEERGEGTSTTGAPSLPARSVSEDRPADNELPDGRQLRIGQVTRQKAGIPHSLEPDVNDIDPGS